LLVKKLALNAPSAFRKFTFNRDMLSASFIAEALSGSDMSRVSLSAKRPLPGGVDSPTFPQISECRGWLKRWSCAAAETTNLRHALDHKSETTVSAVPVPALPPHT
jgi:hypothetical protein